MLVLSFCLVTSVWAERRLRIASYNVENLFDTLHDEGCDDHQFLPDGEYRWTTYRYWEKLHHIAKVIAAMSEDYGPPILIGLSEVENDSVLFDLTRRSELRHLGYDYTITHGPDERGVETALLYQPLLFRLTEQRGMRVPSREYGYRSTRDVLYTKGVLYTGDTLHVCVVHFPSRASHTAAARRNRLLAAQVVRHLADSLSGEKLLVMGDFNAEPGDEIFHRVLTAPQSPLSSLVTQEKKRLRRAEGTYFFRGEWGYLDHMLITPALRRFIRDEALPFKRAFMLTDKGTPFRSFQGPIYRRGYSDHLPLTVEIVIP